MKHKTQRVPMRDWPWTERAIKIKMAIQLFGFVIFLEALERLV